VNDTNFENGVSSAVSCYTMSVITGKSMFRFYFIKRCKIFNSENAKVKAWIIIN